MSSTSSKNSLFSIEPFKLSDNSLFSIEKYNHIKNKRCHVEFNDDVGQSSNSFFSIDPFDLGRLWNNKVVINHECSTLCNVYEDCVNKPLSFWRVPRQVSVKRYNFFEFRSPNCIWYMQAMLWEYLSFKIWKGKLEGVATEVFVT